MFNLTQKITQKNPLCCASLVRYVTPELDQSIKSRRAFWTDEEVQRLQQLFQVNPYPDQQAKRQLR